MANASPALARKIIFIEPDEEMMSKARCLSFIFNTVLDWTMVRISKIIQLLEAHGQKERKASHFSRLGFKHMLGTYFIEKSYAHSAL